jgi:hypothetical protein
MLFFVLRSSFFVLRCAALTWGGGPFSIDIQPLRGFTGYWFTPFGRELAPTSRGSVQGSRFRVAGCRMPEAGSRVPDTGHRQI